MAPALSTTQTKKDNSRCTLSMPLAVSRHGSPTIRRRMVPQVGHATVSLCTSCQTAEERGTSGKFHRGAEKRYRSLSRVDTFRLNLLTGNIFISLLQRPSRATLQ